MANVMFRALIVFLIVATQLAAATETISFSSNNVELAGTLYLPETDGPHPTVLVFHAASGGLRSYPAYQHLITELPAAGFAVFLFDRRGSGESTGDFNTATFQDLALDGIAGISYLKKRKDIDPLRIGVWGVSQGGWLGPLSASLSSDVSFVVSVSGPGVTPAKQMDFSAATALKADGQSDIVIERVLKVREAVNEYFRGRMSRKDVQKAIKTIEHETWFNLAFVYDSETLPIDPKTTKWYREMDYDPIPPLKQVRVPIAFFFAENDAWVPIDESIKIIKSATKSNPNVTIYRIPGTDHLMGTGKPDSGGPTSKEYVKQLLAWLRGNVMKPVR